MRMSYTSIGEARLGTVLDGPIGDQLGQMLLSDGTVPDMDWYVGTEPDDSPVPGYRALLFDCHHRGADGRCGVYDRRPAMCRGYHCEAQEGTRPLEDLLRVTPPAARYEDLAKVTEAVRARLQLRRPQGGGGLVEVPA